MTMGRQAFAASLVPSPRICCRGRIAATRPHAGSSLHSSSAGPERGQPSAEPRRPHPAWKSPLPGESFRGEGSMRTAACILAVVGLLGVTASAARAQYPQRREGFWIGFGLGYGSANVTCGTCGSGSRTEGVTAFLKLGGTPSRNLLIGGARE